jgi:hypothetical protein
MRAQLVAEILALAPWILLTLLQSGVIGTPWEGSGLVVLIAVCVIVDLCVIVGYVTSGSDNISNLPD